MHAPVNTESTDVHALARELSRQERELSRMAREYLEGPEEANRENWYLLVEQAAVQLRRAARELAAVPTQDPAAESSAEETRTTANGSSRMHSKRNPADNVLSGHASVASVSDVLGLLSAMGKNGVLWVDLATETFLVQLQAGSVVYAQGDNPPEGQRLGEILERNGAVSEEDMQAALEASMKSKEVLGAYLLRTKTISQSQLAAALTEQAQMIFHRMFGNPDATYQFDDGLHMVSSQDVRLNVIQLLLESARVSDEGRMEIKAGVPVSLARVA